MADKNINKVIYGSEVLIDLTADTVTPDLLSSGVTAHDKSGKIITGTNTKDSDTTDANASASEILSGQVAYVKGSKVTGTMPNRGQVTGSISTKDEDYAIPNGFHDGSGTVGISSVEKEKLIPTNIREGVSILGVEGTMTGSENVKSQSKEVTPTKDGLTVLPDDGYTHLSQVTISPIPYASVENESGGLSVTIG